PLQIVSGGRQHPVADSVSRLCQNMPDQPFVLPEVRRHYSGCLFTMRFSPFSRFGYSSNQVSHYFGPSLNQAFGHHQAARDKVRPNILCVIEDSARSIEFSLGGVRLTNKVGVDCAGAERGGHVWGRKLNKPDFVSANTLLLHKAAYDEVLIAIPARYSKNLAPKVSKVFRGRLSTDHHRGSVAVTEINNLDRHTLLSEFHCQRD